MRGWLEAAGGTGCRVVYRPEAAPHEPLRYRLSVSFAHVCRLLNVAAAIEVGTGAIPDALASALGRWPEVAVAVRAPNADASALAARAWGDRLALILVPESEARRAAGMWNGPGWVVTYPAPPG